MIRRFGWTVSATLLAGLVAGAASAATSCRAAVTKANRSAQGRTDGMERLRRRTWGSAGTGGDPCYPIAAAADPAPRLRSRLIDDDRLHDLKSGRRRGDG